MCKFSYRLVGVVHCKSNASSWKLVNFIRLRLRSIIWSKGNLKFAWSIYNEISALVLISEGVSADDYGFVPAVDRPGDILDDNRFAEDSSIENIPNCSIWRFPHFL